MNLRQHDTGAESVVSTFQLNHDRFCIGDSLENSLRLVWPQSFIKSGTLPKQGDRIGTLRLDLRDLCMSPVPLHSQKQSRFRDVVRWRRLDCEAIDLEPKRQQTVAGPGLTRIERISNAR